MMSKQHILNYDIILKSYTFHKIYTFIDENKLFRNGYNPKNRSNNT